MRPLIEGALAVARTARSTPSSAPPPTSSRACQWGCASRPACSTSVPRASSSWVLSEPGQPRIAVADWPPVVAIPLALLAGLVAGAAYGFIPGWLKAYTGRPRGGRHDHAQLHRASRSSRGLSPGRSAPAARRSPGTPDVGNAGIPTILGHRRTSSTRCLIAARRRFPSSGGDLVSPSPSGSRSGPWAPTRTRPAMPGMDPGSWSSSP